MRYFSLQALVNRSVTTCAKVTITIHQRLVKMDLNEWNESVGWEPTPTEETENRYSAGWQGCSKWDPPQETLKSHSLNVLRGELWAFVGLERSSKDQALHFKSGL